MLLDSWARRMRAEGKAQSWHPAAVLLPNNAATTAARSAGLVLESCRRTRCARSAGRTASAWTFLDGRVDAVLHTVRAKTPDNAAEAVASNALLQSWS